MASFEEKTTFKLSGGREMVDETRAQELLNAAITGNEAVPFVAINLSNKSFSHPAAEILANYLQQHKDQIQILDLSDIIAGRHEDEALKVLETLCNMFTPYENQLIEVNVSDNALGRKGILALQNVLQGRNLQKLYFCNNGLSAEASELITDILLQKNDYSQTQEANRPCPPLEILHFYNNMSGTAGAQSSAQIILAITNTLRDFRYSATRSGTEGCLPIAQALCQTTNLTHLDLSDNSFGEEVLDALASAISRQVLFLTSSPVICFTSFSFCLSSLQDQTHFT
jgi:Ran GTPase-activating protein 1